MPAPAPGAADVHLSRRNSSVTAGAELLAPKYATYAGPDRVGVKVLATVLAFFAYCFVAYYFTSRVDRVISSEFESVSSLLPPLQADIRASLSHIPVNVLLLSSSPLPHAFPSALTAAIDDDLAVLSAFLPGAAAGSQVTFSASVSAVKVPPKVLVETTAQASEALLALTGASAQTEPSQVGDGDAAAVAEEASRSLEALAALSLPATHRQGLVFVLVDGPSLLHDPATPQWVLGPASLSWAVSPLHSTEAGGIASSLAAAVGAMVTPFAAAISQTSSPKPPTTNAPARAREWVLPPSAYGYSLSPAGPVSDPRGLDSLWARATALALPQPPRTSLSLSLALVHAMPALGGSGSVLRVPEAGVGLRAVPGSTPLSLPPAAAASTDDSSSAEDLEDEEEEGLRGLVRAISSGPTGLTVSVTAHTVYSAPLLPPLSTLSPTVTSPGASVCMPVPTDVLRASATGRKALWASGDGPVPSSSTRSGSAEQTPKEDETEVDSDTVVTVLVISPPSLVPQEQKGGVVTSTYWAAGQCDATESAQTLLLPRWGSATLLPSLSRFPPSSLEQEPADSIAAAAETAAVGTLRALIGLSPTPAVGRAPHKANAFVVSPSRASVSGWELSLWHRQRGILAADAAAAALSSASALVVAAPAMPFPRTLAERAGRAIGALRTAAGAGGAIEKVAGAALEASTLARNTLFDPDMVPLLYFPDEHVYAVYAPLFAPILVPVIVALVKALVAWRAARKAKGEGKRKML